MTPEISNEKDRRYVLKEAEQRLLSLFNYVGSRLESGTCTGFESKSLLQVQMGIAALLDKTRQLLASPAEEAK